MLSPISGSRILFFPNWGPKFDIRELLRLCSIALATVLSLCLNPGYFKSGEFPRHLMGPLDKTLGHELTIDLRLPLVSFVLHFSLTVYFTSFCSVLRQSISLEAKLSTNIVALAGLKLTQKKPLNSNFQVCSTMPGSF